MATITNLVAINDIAHGKQVFRVHGTVTVASPAVEPVLVEPAAPQGGWEVLELQLLDSGAITPQVLTEKPWLSSVQAALAGKPWRSFMQTVRSAAKFVPSRRLTEPLPARSPERWPGTFHRLDERTCGR